MADDNSLVEANKILRTNAQNVSLSASGLMPKSLAEIMDFAQLMARGGPMVGKAFRGNPGACMGISMQALNWGMNPFAVSQKAYITTDKFGNETIAYEAQLVKAVINKFSPTIERPTTEYRGEGAKRVCIVRGVFKGETAIREYISPEIGSIKTKNSPLWFSDPDQQLDYYSSRAWARRWCPEIILGVYTQDEIEDGAAMIDGGTLHSEPSEPAPMAERVVGYTEPGVKTSNKAKKDGDGVWFEQAMRDCTEHGQLEALLDDPRYVSMPKKWKAAYADHIDHHRERIANRDEDIVATVAADMARAEAKASANAETVAETVSEAPEPDAKPKKETMTLYAKLTMDLAAAQDAAALAKYAASLSAELLEQLSEGQRAKLRTEYNAKSKKFASAE